MKLKILCRIRSINPLNAGIFTDFGLGLLEDRVLHKRAWVVTLLGILLGVQDYKKIKFPGRDISSLAVYKGLKINNFKKIKKQSDKIQIFNFLPFKPFQLSIPVRGSKHKGILHSHCTRHSNDGEWKFVKLELEVNRKLFPVKFEDTSSEILVD